MMWQVGVDVRCLKERRTLYVALRGRWAIGSVDLYIDVTHPIYIGGSVMMNVTRPSIDRSS